jgi:hypothetical protein
MENGFVKCASVQAMVLTIEDLKVDQTYITTGHSGILVTNVNIPNTELNNIDDIIARVVNLITTDYFNIANVQFQVCATYELRNTATGDVRQWTGSFNPKGNQTSTLSSFQRFGANFNQRVKRAITPENVYRKLRFFNVETNWVFQRLTSVILSFQSEMNPNHPTLFRRSLLVNQHGRKNRAIVTFLLP